MNADERREALKQELRAYRIESINGLDEYTDGGLADRALVLAEPWLAEARADERRRTAEEIADKLQSFAVSAFDVFGPRNLRGAALWDAAAHIREQMYPTEVGGSDDQQ